MKEKAKNLSFKRFPLQLLMLLVIMTVCMGCGKDAEPENIANASELDGQWAGENGDKLLFLPGEGTYVLEKTNGRIGKGTYDVGNGQIGFNGFIYDLIPQGDGSIILYQNGHAAGDEENLDGAVFTKTGENDIWPYETDMLYGTWVNENGVRLTFDTEAMEYTFSSESGAGVGTIFDHNDGRGLFISPDGALILKSDGTLVIDTEEADFKDTVFSKE